MYKIIDKDNWPRLQQYDFFKDYDNPYFNICTELDVTRLLTQSKDKDVSFFITVLYISIHVANLQKEFRYRMKAGDVIEYDRIHASATVLKEDETFSFCYFDYHSDFKQFYLNARKQIEKCKNGEQKFDGRNNDHDMIHYSTIPWISFTSFTNPRNYSNKDSIPKIVFGKYHETEGQYKLPVSVEVHHAMMDGIHVGKYLTAFQNMIDDCEFLI